jgi:HlyD family secretion protein
VADQGIVVDGRLVPSETVQLSFDTTGKVDEVLVEEGDVVKKGDVIARLGNREALEAALANARLELSAASLELLSAQQARQQLDDTLPDAQTAALAALTTARDILHDAERNYTGVTSPAKQADIDEARANVVLTRDRLDKARENYTPYENKAEDNLVRAALLNELAFAQRNYDNAVRRLNNLLGTGSAFDREQAAAELKIAQERLALAQQDYDEIQAGPDPDEVALVEGRIATAENRIAAAEAAIQSGEAALENLELTATINGTVVELDLIAGQRVTPGVPVVRLADFSQWFVETDDLTEIEVVDVAVGDTAAITPDALPELELSGSVDKINDLFEEKRGDVTYTARIALQNADPRLRWGMTVVVSFQP